MATNDNNNSISDPLLHVYIAGMALFKEKPRGPAYSTYVNVTHCQGTKNASRRAFSPKTLIEGGYKGYPTFEAYWNAGKVYEGIPHATSQDWWKENNKLKIKVLQKTKVLHFVFDGATMDLITARKIIFVPEYLKLIEATTLMKGLINMSLPLSFINNTPRNFIIYDLEGPRDSEDKPIMLPMTKDLFMEKINDPDHDFSHGYIVAARLANIDLSNLLPPEKK